MMVKQQTTINVLPKRELSASVTLLYLTRPAFGNTRTIDSRSLPYKAKEYIN